MGEAIYKICENLPRIRTSTLARIFRDVPQEEFNSCFSSLIRDDWLFWTDDHKSVTVCRYPVARKSDLLKYLPLEKALTVLSEYSSSQIEAIISPQYPANLFFVTSSYTDEELQQHLDGKIIISKPKTFSEVTVFSGTDYDVKLNIANRVRLENSFGPYAFESDPITRLAVVNDYNTAQIIAWYSMRKYSWGFDYYLIVDPETPAVIDTFQVSPDNPVLEREYRRKCERYGYTDEM